MIQLWKETLLPGTQFDVRSKRPFTITQRDIRCGERNINRMVGKGRRIPIIYEHLDVEECDPEEWKANYARNTIGWVGGARLSTAADVAAGVASKSGTLLVRHDIHDEKDVQQVRRTGFVSPKIYFDGYRDSQGEEYRGLAVSHVASSPTVCQFWQQPFQLSDDDAFYLSYTPPDDDSDNSADDPIDTPEIPALPRAAPAPKSPARSRGTSSPAEDWSFDGWLADARRAAGLDPVDLSTTEPPEAEPVADDKPDDEGDKKKPGDGDGGMSADLKDLKKALQAHGINISEKASTLREFVIAIESSGSGGASDDLEDDKPDDAEPATAPAPGGPPMLMSTFDKNTRASVQEDLADVRNRIDACVKDGRMQGFKARQLLRRLNPSALKLSVTEDGALTGPQYDAVLKELAAAEGKSPARKDGVSLSNTEPVARPDLGGTGGKELGEKIANWIVNGGKIPAKQ